MRRTIRTLAILILLALGIGVVEKEQHEPKPRAKVPTTRFHGYEINRQAINRAKDFTVLISNEGFAGTWRGTGVLIDATHVLTCAHIAENAEEALWVYPYPADIVLRGKTVFIDKSVDLAVLELNQSVNIPHYAIFMDMHYDGEPITIIGNTMGAMKWFISFGIISGDWEGYLLTDGVLYGGNSGGPWINEQGEVVALTDWTLVKKGVESDIHGGVSAKTINRFLEEWKSPSIGQILQMMLGGN